MHEQLPEQNGALKEGVSDSHESSSRVIYQELIEQKSGAYKENEAYIREQIKHLQSANMLQSNLMSEEDWELLVRSFGAAIDQKSIPDNEAQKREWIRVVVEGIYASK